jgi:hypothetical protein
VPVAVVGDAAVDGVAGVVGAGGDHQRTAVERGYALKEAQSLGCEGMAREVGAGRDAHVARSPGSRGGTQRRHDVARRGVGVPACPGEDVLHVPVGVVVGEQGSAQIAGGARGAYVLDEDVAMWLASGWWVSLRNQFAKSPDVATEILTSVEDELAEFTARLSDARGERTEGLTAELFGTVFDAEGPDYWR